MYLMNDFNYTSSINQNNQTQYNELKYPVVNDCVNNCQLHNDCKTCCKSKCHQLNTDVSHLVCFLKVDLWLKYKLVTKTMFFTKY